MSEGEAKAVTRSRAFAARADAHRGARPDDCAHLDAALAPYSGRPLAGYHPIRTEIDPLPAMIRAADHSLIALPVIEAKGAPLRFRRWTPDCEMVRGPFGAQVPAGGDWLVPEILIVPLVAFDRRGGRLGYGGGFYDRTLERLRARGPIVAIGFAFAAQEFDDLPLEPTDQPLDLIVTELETIVPDF